MVLLKTTIRFIKVNDFLENLIGDWSKYTVIGLKMDRPRMKSSRSKSIEVDGLNI